MSGNIVILLRNPEVVPGTLFHPGGIGDVNLYRKSIDKSLMLYGKWLSNIMSVDDKVVLVQRGQCSNSSLHPDYT